MKSYYLKIHSLLIPLALIMFGGYYAQGEGSDCGASLNISNTKIGSNIPANFLSSPHIVNLTMKGNNIKLFANGSFSGLPNLKYLDLSNNNMSQKKLFSFGSLPNLEVLVLDNNTAFNRYNSYFGEKGVNKFHRVTIIRANESLDVQNEYPKLQCLSVRNVNLLDLSKITNASFPQLNTLDISENEIKTDKFGSIVNTVKKLIMTNMGLSSLGDFPPNSIESLDISRNNFSILCNSCKNSSVLALSSFKNLKNLTLSKCNIKSVEMDAFEPLGNLSVLDISGNDFTQLVNGTFDYASTLKKLDLSGNNLTQMPNISALQELASLALNEMKSPSVLLSATFPLLENLISLSIRGNGLTELSASLTASFPNLEELDLSNNLFTVLPALDLKNLRQLRVHGNFITNYDNIYSPNLTKVQDMAVLSDHFNMTLFAKNVV